MAIGFGSVQNSGTAGTALGIAGHFEILVENPDGTTSYLQTDNFINGAAKTNVATAVFENVALNQPNNCIILGTGNPDDTSNGIVAALGTTGVKCTDDLVPAGAFMICNGLADSGTTAEQCVAVTKHVTDAADCNPCTITEAAIGVGTSGNAALGSTFAYGDLNAAIIANAGATVTTVYIVATGGVVVL